MDSATRTFMGALLADNERYEQQAHLALAIARMLQDLATLHGDSLGLPEITPEMPPPALRQVAATLAKRLQPPTPQSEGDDQANGAGKRIAVAPGVTD